jgi:hypothetical protein
LIANSTDRQAQKTDAVPKPPDTGFIVFTKTIKIGQFTVQNSNKIDQTKMVYQPLGFYDFDFHFLILIFFTKNQSSAKTAPDFKKPGSVNPAHRWHCTIEVLL